MRAGNSFCELYYRTALERFQQLCNALLKKYLCCAQKRAEKKLTEPQKKCLLCERATLKLPTSVKISRFER